METDKATMEVEAQEGYLSKIKVNEGSEVPVGQLLALISDTNEDSHNDQTIWQTLIHSKRSSLC